MKKLPASIRQALAVGVTVGLVLGVIYSVGGFFIDLMGPGLNAGTALAFLALIGMPVLFGAAGLIIGGIAHTVRHH
ncbi:MAG: hypothetical protein AAFS02_16500 [Pseudomonadota bacterium]